MSNASDAKIIDAAVEEYLKSLDGDDYTKGAVMPWVEVCERWERFTTNVALLDGAIKQPLTDSAATILTTAQSLISTESHELAGALKDAGEALLQKVLTRRLKPLT